MEKRQWDELIHFWEGFVHVHWAVKMCPVLIFLTTSPLLFLLVIFYNRINDFKEISSNYFFKLFYNSRTASPTLIGHDLFVSNGTPDGDNTVKKQFKNPLSIWRRIFNIKGAVKKNQFLNKGVETSIKLTLELEEKTGIKYLRFWISEIGDYLFFKSLTGRIIAARAVTKDEYDLLIGYFNNLKKKESERDETLYEQGKQWYWDSQIIGNCLDQYKNTKFACNNYDEQKYNFNRKYIKFVTKLTNERNSFHQQLAKKDTNIENENEEEKAEETDTELNTGGEEVEVKNENENVGSSGVSQPQSSDVASQHDSDDEVVQEMEREEQKNKDNDDDSLVFSMLI